MGARAVSRDLAVPRGVRLRRQGRHHPPRGHPLPAEGPAVEDAHRLHAPGDHAAAPADAARDGRARRARAVRRQPLRQERHAAHHGEGDRRSGRLHPPRQGSVGLREGRDRRLVGRRLAVAALPGAGGEADHHRDAGRRSRRHQGGEADSGRRDDLPGGAYLARSAARRVDRSLGARRERSRQARSRARPLRPAQSE